MDMVGVLSIKRPLERVVGDVLANAVEVGVVADDVFVVVALPEGEAGGVA